MNTNTNNIVTADQKGRIFILVPVAGIIAFSILYYCATLLYPGGSQADRNSIGFSWMHNYWCNLLSADAVNGDPNAGRGVAITAMIIVCVSLSLFWYLFPAYAKLNVGLSNYIRISGTLAMFVALFVFTDYHTPVIYLSSALGLIAVIATIIGLKKLEWMGLLWFGVFNLLIVLVDHYIYYTREFLYYLPLLQKINFALFLLWIVLITVKLYRSN